MRLFFFLLVFANLVLFAWTQAYFGATDDSREPQRLEQQLHAEKLRVVRPTQAPAVTKNEAACRVVNGLGLANAEALKAAMEAAGGQAKVLPLAEPTRHLVVISDLANKAAADRKAAELARFGVAEQTSVELEGGRYEIILGSFPTEPGAREFLQGLVKRGIKSARVDSREPAALKAGVETRAPSPELARLLPQLIAPYAAATIGECAQ